MIEALDALAPGISSMHTLLYGVEVKFYSSRPKLSPVLETEIKNLFSIGDGAGVSRGLVQASASGVLCGQRNCLEGLIWRSDNACYCTVRIELGR